VAAIREHEGATRVGVRVVLDVVFAEVLLGGHRVAGLDQRAPGVVDEALVGGERRVVAAHQRLVVRALHDGQRRLELERAGIRVSWPAVVSSPAGEPIPSVTSSAVPAVTPSSAGRVTVVSVAEGSPCPALQRGRRVILPRASDGQSEAGEA
jgi:hypothetical protein